MTALRDVTSMSLANLSGSRLTMLMSYLELYSRARLCLCSLWILLPCWRLLDFLTKEVIFIHFCYMCFKRCQGMSWAESVWWEWCCNMAQAGYINIKQLQKVIYSVQCICNLILFSEWNTKTREKKHFKDPHHWDFEKQLFFCLVLRINPSFQAK